MTSVSAICGVVILFTTGSLVQCDIQDDVTFYLSTDQVNRTLLTDGNLDNIDVNNPIAIIIHGWIVNSTVSWVIELTDALLDSNEDYNVIAVDYTRIAQLDYVSAVAAARVVGAYVGEFIANLHTNYGADLTNIHIIGHSLGGQISGFAGKAVQNLTSSNVARITGLDPANPLFLPTDPEGRLTNTDADLVVALHTDGFVFGYFYPIGGIDFYANTGIAPQPGCVEGDLNPLRCSHMRATYYFIEAVRNPSEFESTECSDYFLYDLGSCDGNKTITLGGNLTENDIGKYYFRTESDSPYYVD